jgi:hypothetical protein
MLMGRSVFIDFPIPTLEEYGKSLGMSKKRQKALIEIVRQDRAAHPIRKADTGKVAEPSEVKSKKTAVSRAR